MASNQLTGTIPSEISRWTALNEFNVENNDIRGSLHPAMDSLVGLTFFCQLATTPGFEESFLLLSSVGQI
jgi:hypothetical protein